MRQNRRDYAVTRMIPVASTRNRAAFAGTFR
jgi:hypothetical protein